MMSNESWKVPSLSVGGSTFSIFPLLLHLLSTLSVRHLLPICQTLVRLMYMSHVSKNISYRFQILRWACILRTQQLNIGMALLLLYFFFIFSIFFDDPTLFLKAVVYNYSFSCVSHELLLKVEFIGYDLPDPGSLSPMSLWLIYFRRRYCCD